jgi:hypothetical protein
MGGSIMSAGMLFQRLSAQLRDFLEPFVRPLPPAPARVVGELVAGAVFTGSVQLTNAARVFAQTNKQLERAVERMSHHLADPRWDHAPLQQALLQQQAHNIDDHTLMPIDLTDLAKPYARHMQYLATVRDASDPQPHTVPGYWCFQAYRFEAPTEHLTPLMMFPFSQNHPCFRSENHILREAFWPLRQATAGRGLWVMDRGFDRKEVIDPLLCLKVRWIIRQRGDRYLIGPEGSIRSAQQWAEYALKTHPQRGRAVTLPVQLPWNPTRLWLVVPTWESPDGDRQVLLTCGLVDQRHGPRQIRYDYAYRWRAEDGARFLGQIFHFERFLVRCFVAIYRTMVLAAIALAFVSELLRDDDPLADAAMNRIVRWDREYRIPVYRVAAGIQAIAAQAGIAALPNNA